MGTKLRSLVTGAGGFVGHHLVSFLRARGHWVRGVDLKRPDFCASDANEFELLDLRRWENCVRATREIDEVYALAAEIGEIDGTFPDHAQILEDNCLINFHCIDAARQNHVSRYLYTSSASVYPEPWYGTTSRVPQKEGDVRPDAPQDANERTNLVSERLCVHYRRSYGLETRIVRLGDVFGPVGPWFGGKEKAPTALCCKIAAAQLEGLNEIEICGDGRQTGSFCYIDDCVMGLHKVMRSDCSEPLNLRPDRTVSINELADIVANIAGVRLCKKYLPGSQRLRECTSDNTGLKELLRWEPKTPLEEGLKRTYLWVEKQVREVALEYSFGIVTFPPRPGNKSRPRSPLERPFLVSKREHDR